MTELPPTICGACQFFRNNGPFIKICEHYKRNIVDTVVVECDYFQKKGAAE